jgi:sialidase-1
LLILNRKYLIGFILISFFLPVAKAQDNTAAKTTRWQGFEQVHVTIQGHKAYYVKPAKPLPGNPWVWRTSFPDWHTEMDSLLLSRGFHVVFLNVDDQYGAPSAMRVYDKFYTYLTDTIKLASKTAIEGVSRGGLYALNWAKRNPDKVSCIYAETPVYDFKSWPGGKGTGPGGADEWKQLKEVYGFTEQQALDYKDNPVDNLEGLASFKVPVLNVIGLDDKLAPPAENSLLFAQRYIALGGPVSTYPATEGPQVMQGHHFPIKHAAEYAGFIYYNSYPVKAPLAYDKYFTVRGGVSNFYKAVNTDKKATVAFLGGSITFNPGWRDKVCTYLKETFPQTQFTFIAAGIPSLGSLPHTFRLQQDVLAAGKTDLLFLEAAVNDRVNKTDSLTQVRALEGIIRHAKNSNPKMDIVLMEFADPDKTTDYNNNITPVEIINHEMVAARYNLPSINIAKEVRDKINNKEFDWNDDFKDLHPSPFGQELYFANIKKLLEVSANTSVKTNSAKLPVPLNNANFEYGSYYNIGNAKHDNLWAIADNWQPADGLATRPGFVNVPMLVTEKAGAELTLPFKGTAVGMAVVSGSDAGIVSYSIDGLPFKDIDLYTPWSGMLHLPWYVLFSGNLKNGSHTLKIKISANKNSGSKGHACRIVNFLVNH